MGSSASLPLPFAFSSMAIGYHGPMLLTRGTFVSEVPYTDGEGSQRGFFWLSSIKATATLYRAGFVGPSSFGGGCVSA